MFTYLLAATWRGSHITLRTMGRKVVGSNPIGVMQDCLLLLLSSLLLLVCLFVCFFSPVQVPYPELGVLWAQWVFNSDTHIAGFHPLHGCVFEGIALIISPTLQVPQVPGLVNTGIIMTLSVVRVLTSSLKPKMDRHRIVC